MGFWGWSAHHVLNGHPNQPQRGALHNWLRAEETEAGPAGAAGEMWRGSDALRYDVALVHLGTNDLGARAGVKDIVATMHEIVLLLHAHQPHALVLVAKIIPNTLFSVSELNTALEKHFSGTTLSLIQLTRKNR